MDERTEDVIHEESEDAQSFTTDSFVDEGRDEDDREDEFEDYTSLAFERDLETNSKSYRFKLLIKITFVFIPIYSDIFGYITLTFSYTLYPHYTYIRIYNIDIFVYFVSALYIYSDI